ncbi:MAG: flavodoxin [Eubacterium sp.]|nr:flavodoxin [Eubacterium sp.]
MKFAVRYYSKTGHTTKLAKAIADAVGVEAKTVDVPLEEDVDILFLGSAVYATALDANVKQFIDSINVNVGKVVSFSSAAILSGTYKQVKAACEKKGIAVADEEFFCKGQFKMIAKGRPNAQDEADAAAFAKKFL